MQNERIFSAPSLAEVIKQLLIYRPTGVLTIWRAGGLRQEDVRISIEQGHLLRVFWGSYTENANETVLGWINSWGPLHFSFLSTESHLQLPAPGQTGRQEQPPVPQPLVKQVPPLQRPALATVIVSHTRYGKDYPPSYLPRYDRTIFLLINGQRTVVDLSQLTKRSLEEVYNTLHRLQNLQLITVESRLKRAR